MIIADARQLKDHDYVTNGIRLFHVRIHHANKHDLWFWHCRKHSKELKQKPRGGGYCTRVYLGSKNVPVANLMFLQTLSPAY